MMMTTMMVLTPLWLDPISSQSKVMCSAVPRSSPSSSSSSFVWTLDRVLVVCESDSLFRFLVLAAVAAAAASSSSFVVVVFVGIVARPR